VERGDISNLVVPRIVIVFDNYLGILPTKAAEAKFGTYIRFKRWKKASRQFVLNAPVSQQIWDLTWRSKFSVDVVTHLGGEEFGDAIQEWVDRYSLPVGHVWFEEADSLARSLAYRPDIACVITTNHHHQFKFGSKGRIVQPTDHLNGVI
jgi:hypothetical protein